MQQQQVTSQVVGEIVDAAQRPAIDLRMVLALAGTRELNAREQQVMDKLRQERGESLYADMLYALTRKNFPSRQAKTVWADISHHRINLERLLGRDPGVVVAAHDYLSNVSGLLRGAGLIEENKFNALATVASRDGLTGLYDKATFTRMLQEELNRQARHSRVCTLIIADIDYFKRLNDTHGHADGDLVLQQVADIFARIVRGTDTAGRFGGEEFGVILPETDAKAGAILAERLRTAIENHFSGSGYAVTMSFGVACAVPEGKAGVVADTLIRAADAALYAAKHAGRNCVKVSE